MYLSNSILNDFFRTNACSFKQAFSFIRFKLYLSIGNFCHKLRYIIFILCVLTSKSLFAWGPESGGYEAEAPVIGAWRGEYQGETFEIALWPSTSHKLMGAMVWGECKAEISFSGGQSDKFIEKKEDKSSPLSKYLYTLASYPHLVRMRSNRCPAKDWPGYSRLFFNSDESFSELEMLVYSEYPKLRQLPSALVRTKPSRTLQEVIEYVSRTPGNEVSDLAKKAIDDSTLDYLQLFEADALLAADSPKEDFSDINNIDFLKSKNIYYWRENYDRTMADIILPVLRGEFKRAEGELYYFYTYTFLMQAYSAQCNNYIKDKTRITITTTATTTRRYGTPDRDTSVGYIDIESRYADAYITARKRSSDVSRVMSYSTYVATIPKRVKKLIEIEKCDSLTTRRLLENYYRNVSNLYPLEN